MMCSSANQREISIPRIEAAPKKILEYRKWVFLSIPASLRAHVAQGYASLVAPCYEQKYLFFFYPIIFWELLRDKIVAFGNFAWPKAVLTSSFSL